MKYRDVPVYIIHLQQSTDRLPYIEKLQQQFSNVKIVDAIWKEDIPDAEWYLDLKNFTRMPTLKTTNLLGRVACFLSHQKALQQMDIDNVDKAIILEDDAILQDESLLEMEVPNEPDIVVLGHNRMKDNNKPTGTWAILYNRKSIYRGVLASMNNFKWRSYDLWLYYNVYKYVDTQFYKYFTEGSTIKKEVKSLVSEGMSKKSINNLV
jgi:GR25 family glycosyltransferase involved in LPS biosynthesis